MDSWSTFYQNCEYMEYTRIGLIGEELRPLVLNWCGIKDNMKVLDVGCGTGYFTRFLGESDFQLELIGIDKDEKLVEYAQESTENSDNFTFMIGDALNLPFDDSTFDVVSSHTFLHAINDPIKAIKEMIRVCKPGGKICAVSPMGFGAPIYSKGHYPKECSWVLELEELRNEIWDAYEMIKPISNAMTGLNVNEVPYCFSRMGLSNVCAYPLGKFFSLSNDAVSEDIRKEYIHLLYKSEERKIASFAEIPQFSERIPVEKQNRYLQLLHSKCKYLLENIGENSIWELSGGANLLTVGTVAVTKDMHWIGM